MTKPSFPLLARIALLAVGWPLLTGSAHAQFETVLHEFDTFVTYNDGVDPNANLIQGADGNFYGTTESGGMFPNGVIFKITPSGTETILHGFGDGTVTNDGAKPYSAITLGTDGNFYGTTEAGGSANDGTVFRITPSGTVTILHSFGDGSVANDGITPYGGLVQGSDGNFYGTTYSGGSALSAGTVFKITPSGTETILHKFDDGSVANDGYGPQSALIQASDGNFYGTALGGGSNSTGVVFEITPSGTLTILHSFDDGTVTNDGISPGASLIQGTDGNFYGTTSSGGAGGYQGVGTVFKITPSGTVTILHSFADGTVANDGYGPTAALIQGADGNFYGTTSLGGAGAGTIFKITPTGTVTILHNFADGTVPGDGYEPAAGLVLGSDGNFYGTAKGGNLEQGVVYKLVLNFPNLTSPVTASGNVALPFSYQITGTNTPTSFATTALPNGLSMNADGLITGTPTTVGTTTVTLTLINSSGSSTFPLTITIVPLPVPQVTSILTAYGSTGSAFTYQTVAINNPASFAATGLTGTGLSIDSTSGIISGTPTTAGTITAGLTATNSIGTGASVNLVIKISGTPPTQSQEYNLLHYFGTGTTGGDAALPNAIIQAFDGNFYGTSATGGAANSGTVFTLSVQGIESVFYSFPSVVKDPTSLIQAADGNFYGTTAANNQIFKLTPAGQLTVLYSFGAASASNNFVGLHRLIQGADGNFYGTTSDTQSTSGGTVFEITPQGALTILHTFGDGSTAHDGGDPFDSVVQGSDGNFYGTTPDGGTAGFGCAYRITPSGSYSILHNFGDGNVTSDGEHPDGCLVQGADGNFYGTTASGGSATDGTVYKMTPAGAVTILHSFGDGMVTHDGFTPVEALIQGNDGNFYGTTSGGGSAQKGTIFQIASAGVLTTIHNFGDPTVTDDAIGPDAPLVQSTAGNIYGVTNASANGAGTVFSIIPTLIPSHAPVFTGSAYASSGIYTPLTFTPKAAFGVSGSQALVGNGIPASASSGSSSLLDTLVSLFSSSVHKNFSQTNWTLTQGTTTATMLPNDLTFDSTSGTISGTPVEAGTFTFTMTPNNALGSGTPQTITLYIDVPPGINSGADVSCVVGTPFTYQIVSTPPADSFGATLLPGWLTANPVSGLISGTPPAAGLYIFDAVAANISGQSIQTIALTVTGGASSVPAITSPTTASGALGHAFTYQIATSSAATSYSALTLPPGLVFDSPTGTITGVPTQTGTFSIPLGATNANGSYSAVLSLTIAVLELPSLASSLVATAAENAPFSYQIPASGGITGYTATGLPNGLTCDATTGVITGTPTVTGPFAVAITATNILGTGSSTLHLTVEAPSNFGSWASANGVAVNDYTSAPKNDGVPNLFKYLYDIDPTTALSTADRAALPVLGTATVGNVSYLTITYRQYALESNLGLELQTCTDLKTWTPVNPLPLTRQIGTDPVTGDPIMQIGVPATGSFQFIRLNVTAP